MQARWGMSGSGTVGVLMSLAVSASSAFPAASLGFTFFLHGWCMLGVFLLPAFTRKSFWGNGVRTYVISKRIIPSSRKILPRGAHNAALSRTASPTLSYSGPVLLHVMSDMWVCVVCLSLLLFFYTVYFFIGIYATVGCKWLPKSCVKLYKVVDIV